jgi:Tfp pilus assembly protein PilN
MRPVNLIPPEDRRGEQAPLRTGALVYLVVGAFVAILVGITAMVLIGNQVSDRKDEVASLKRQDALAAAQASRVASYTQFRALSEQRLQTVNSLADSRFDWERVMRELSLVLPGNVWLVNLTASAAPGVSVGSGGGSGSGLRAAAAGPALELNGCASSQQAVAGFVTNLKDIDGVTRVGVQSSELASEEHEAASSPSGEAGPEANEDCRTRAFIAKFQVLVAFDAAPVPVLETTEAPPVEAPAEGPEAESTETSTETTEEGG